jgi:Tol biopolymer transport system component
MGPLPLDDALSIARQIVEALESAHDRGVVHRDLKPANIKITPEGVVKVLDFGLAKVLEDEPPKSPLGNSPTVTVGHTRAGVILSTAAYMSPEQAIGRPVDRRSDIFSFGAVLYEMLAGKRAFTGTTAPDVLEAVVKKDPDWSALPTGTPGYVRRLLERTLAKDRKERLQAIGEARIMLAKPQTEEPALAAGATAPSPARFGRLPSIAAGVLPVVAAVSLWAPRRSTQPVDRPLVRLDVDLGADVSLPAATNAASVYGSTVAISPDGMRLVYASGTPTKLFTRRLDQSKSTELPGTQGAVAPFFSPDGQWIGFRADGKLSKISVEGGAVIALGDVGLSAGAGWSEDGNILTGSTKGLLRIRDSGGPPETVVALGNGGVGLAFPQILPGGKAVLFSAYTAPNPDASSIEVLTLADHHRKTVSRGGTSPRYLATSNVTGYLVYLNKATLFAIPFDLEKLETRGAALPILDDVASNGVVGTAQLSISRTGTLVYRRGGESSELLTVAWLDGAGKTRPLLAKPGAYAHPSLSPDGQRLALEVTEGSGADIWVYDWQRDTMTRLTFDGRSRYPIWSPDGRNIVLQTPGAGMSVTRSDGAGKPQPLTQSKNLQYPWSFTADGKRMAFYEQDSKTGRDLWTVPMESDGAGLRAGKPELFLQTPADERDPALSPDGRWLAYASNESGTFQIYVRAFPDKGGKWQISNAGGAFPMWSRTGHELFFEIRDSHIMAAPYRVLGDSFVADKPRLWSERPIASGNGIRNWNFDLAPDGKRIVALMPATEAKGSQEAQNQVTFLLNFFDELRRRVPTAK